MVAGLEQVDTAVVAVAGVAVAVARIVVDLQALPVNIETV